jgi:hypothetical protein
MQNDVSCVPVSAKSEIVVVDANASVGEGKGTAKNESEDEYFNSVGDIIDSTKNKAIQLLKYFNNAFKVTAKIENFKDNWKVNQRAEAVTHYPKIVTSLSLSMLATSVQLLESSKKASRQIIVTGTSIYKTVSSAILSTTSAIMVNSSHIIVLGTNITSTIVRQGLNISARLIVIAANVGLASSRQVIKIDSKVLQ